MIAFNKDEIFTISLALKTLKQDCEQLTQISQDKELVEALKVRIKDCNNAYEKIVREYRSLDGGKN